MECNRLCAPKEMQSLGPKKGGRASVNALERAEESEYFAEWIEEYEDELEFFFLRNEHSEIQKKALA